MKKPFEAWDDHIGKRLQQLQPEPAFDAWDRIEAALDEKPKRSWIWMAASTSLLAASMGFVFWKLNVEQPAGKGLAQQQESHHRPAAPKGQGLAENAEPLPLSPGSISATESSREHASPPATRAQLQSGHTASSANAVSTSALATKQNKTAALAEQSLAASDHVFDPADRSGQFAGTDAQKEERAQAENSPLFMADQDQTVELQKLASVAPKDQLKGFRVKVSFIPQQVLALAEGIVAENKAKNKSGAVLWAEAMPTWSTSQLEPRQENSMDALVISAVDEPSVLASERLGGQLATGISLPVGKNLHWKSGAYYWYQQQRLSYNYHSARPDGFARSTSDAGEFSLTPVYNERTNHVDQDLHNLGLSTGLRYDLPLSFLPSALETRVQAHYNAYQKLSSLLCFGYSVRAKLDEKLKLHIGPSVQFQLNNSQSIGPHFRERPLTLGLQMGLSFDD